MKLFESTLPKDYRKGDVERLLQLVLSGRFAQLISLPGGGKATVLKLLTYNKTLRKFHLGEREKTVRFVYFNLLEIPNFDQITLEKFILLSLSSDITPEDDPLRLTDQLKAFVNNLTNQNQTTLVLLFDHFDEFQNQLPRFFFQMLRTLRGLGKYKFVCVFGTRRDVATLVDPELLKAFYDFFTGNAIYMNLVDQTALDFIRSQVEDAVGKKLTKSQSDELTTLTGGHTKLFRVAAETMLRDLPAGRQEELSQLSLLKNPLVRAALFELWLFLTSEEQKVLLSISKNEQIESTDALKTLINFGILKQFNNVTMKQLNAYAFTIPLFEAFVKNVAKNLPEEKIVFDKQTREIKKGQEIISDLLSPQEYRLLKLLIGNEGLPAGRQGKITTREEIVHAVWSDVKTAEGISEAAIDQMIFRLRKKIEEEPNRPKHLVTVKGQGLRFTL